MATYRGHVSKRLSGLVLDGDVTSADSGVYRVYKDDKDIGQVTSAVASPALDRHIALAYLKYGFFEPGNKVQVKSEDISIPAEVVELPFYKPTA
jgi:glycine cleavage system aminomethyltransferase T